MKLNKFTEIEIIPSTPFNFDATFYKPDHFTTDDHKFEKGIRWQTATWKDKKLGLKYQNSGTIDKPKLKVGIYSSLILSKEFIESLKTEIIYRYNLNLELSDFYKLGKKNELLAAAIKDLNGMRPGHPSSLYEYLIIGIILQNASVRRSIQMFKNLLQNYGTVLEFDGQKLFCLWDIGRFSNIDEMELRNLKVGYRAKSIIKIDKQFSEGLINEFDLRAKDCTTQKKTLISLYGVGPATVWYLLFDVFHHWEVFEHISPWEQKLYSRMFFDKELVTTTKLLSFINKFGKFKHLAVHYIWEKLWWDRHNGKTYDWFEKEIRA